MDFSLTEEQQVIKRSVREMMEDFPLEYWRERDRTGEFPEEFFQACARQGFLGITMPEAYGGADMGLLEAVLVLEEIAAAGAGNSGTSAIHMNIFGIHPLLRHGTEEQKSTYLPAVIEGDLRVAFAVTESDAGLETPRISTFAERTEGGWELNGSKAWISTAQEAEKMLIIARTTPYEEVEKKTDGMTLFFADLQREEVDIQEIEKCGRAAVDSNVLYIDGLKVDEEDVVGEVGKGFYHLLDGINPERILIAAESVGIGRASLDIATDYARERVVFDRPIGKNQGVQFPLAECHADLELARLMIYKAAVLYDSEESCGAEANIAKLKGAKAGYRAADQAMQTLGGNGYAREYHVERLWREAKLFRLAPITPELILSYLGEHVLNLPKSY